MSYTLILVLQKQLPLNPKQVVVGGQPAKTSHFMMNPRNTHIKMLIH